MLLLVLLLMSMLLVSVRMSVRVLLGSVHDINDRALPPCPGKRFDVVLPWWSCCWWWCNGGAALGVAGTAADEDGSPCEAEAPAPLPAALPMPVLWNML